MIHPTPNGLVGHRHSAFRQQVLDVTQAEGEPEVEPYRLVNDLWREPVSSVADLLHPAGYGVPRRTESPSRRDNGKCRDFSRRTLLARQLTKSTVLSAQISTLDTSADLPSAYFPRRST